MAKQLLLHLDSYYSELDKALICKASIKKDFMADLKSRIDEFAEENQTVSIDELIAHFGQPEDIAQTFLESLSPGEIKKAMNWKKPVLIGVIALFLMAGIYLVISFIDGHNFAEGYGVDGEIIEETLETLGG